MVPLTLVDRLLLPTVSWLPPRKNVLQPAIEPALTLLSPLGPVVPEKSTEPAPLAVMAALPAVLLSSKVTKPSVEVMVALKAVARLRNARRPPAVTMSRALPAVLLLENCVCEAPSVVMVALPAVAESVKEMSEPPPALMITALPADEFSEKVRKKLLVMLAVPAVDAFWKNIGAVVDDGGGAGRARMC